MDDDNRTDLYIQAGRHMLADLPLSMVLTDPNRPDNPIVYVNKAFELTTGYASSHAVGRNCRFLQGGNHDQPEVRELSEAVSKKESATVTLRNYRADGTEFLNRLMIAPVIDGEGQLFAFVGIQTVVTEADAAEGAGFDFSNALQEMQHRVKNHLQMVASMIRLQSTGPTEAVNSFNVLSRRVESLAALYDEFSSPPTVSRDARYDVVSAGGYVGRVVAAVGALDGRRDIRLTIDTDPVYMRSARAANLGLMVSEVLSNALQHAFRDRGEGLIEVRLKQAGGNRVRLTVTDDGAGLGDSDWPNGGSMGSRIVRGLAQQMQAELNVTSSDRGTVVVLDFVNDLPTDLDAEGERLSSER